MNSPSHTAAAPGNWSNRVPGAVPGTCHHGKTSAPLPASATAPSSETPVASVPSTVAYTPAVPTEVSVASGSR